MPYYGSERCVGCGGEDCVCCEVYLEWKSDQAYSDQTGFGEQSIEDYDEYEYDDADDCDESMDGDHESGLASAGFGTDEDYNHYDGSDD